MSPATLQSLFDVIGSGLVIVVFALGYLGGHSQ